MIQGGTKQIMIVFFFNTLLPNFIRSWSCRLCWCKRVFARLRVFIICFAALNFNDWKLPYTYESRHVLSYLHHCSLWQKWRYLHYLLLAFLVLTKKCKLETNKCTWTYTIIGHSISVLIFKMFSVSYVISEVQILL